MASVLKNLSKILNRPQKIRIMVLFVMMVIGAFFEAMSVSLMLPLMKGIMQPDIIEKNEIVKWVCELLDLHSHRTFVVACIFALIVVFVTKDLYMILEYYVQARFICNNRFATQQKILKSFLKRPYEFFLNADNGEVMRMISGDVSRTYALISTLLMMGTETIVSLAVTVTIFIIDPVISCFMAVIMLVMVLVIIKVVRPIYRKSGREYQVYSSATGKWMLQAMNGIKEIKVTNKEDFFEYNYSLNGRKLISVEKKSIVLGNIPRLMIEMTSVSAILALIGIMIYRGRELETLIPTLGAFAMAALKLMPGANRIVGAVNEITYSGPAVESLIKNLDILNSSEENIEEINSGDPLEFNEEVILSKIEYKYPNSNKQVLKNADMSVPIGKSVGIVGTSGAGKTTAVDVMLGLLKPESGQVLCDGVDVMTNYSSWLEMIGYIPQSIFMIDDSIRANVAFGIKEKDIDDDQVWYALEEAQLADFVRELPQGINTGIGSNGVRLSGGQRQRVGIARALYKNPKLLVFDEATSALDNETEAAIMESINSLHGKKTMIIIAHRLQTIEGCDIVYRVADGKITRER